MNRIKLLTILAAFVTVVFSSCTREDRFDTSYYPNETHTILNLYIADNTKSDVDSIKFFDTEKNLAFIDSKVALGLVGVDKKSLNVLVDNQPVYENDGVRTADLVTSCLSSGSMKASVFYPYRNSVSYHNDGSYVITFSPDDIKKGPLASNAVEMRCDKSSEIINLNLHHIANSIGFKACDITDDDQLRGLMRIRKVVINGMPSEGLFVVDEKDSYWVPNANREQIVVFEGNESLSYGGKNASFVANDRLSNNRSECNRFYVVPEQLTDGKHFVEVFFDVDPFDYEGTHYRGANGMSQKISLAGVIPDDVFELGLQYTFVLGINLASIYRPLEFTAVTDDWEDSFSGRVLDFDNM